MLAGLGDRPINSPSKSFIRPLRILFDDAALLRSNTGSICIELRALVIASISSGPIECDLSALSKSVTGNETDRFDSVSFRALFEADWS